jgi:hypothetical protein
MHTGTERVRAQQRSACAHVQSENTEAETTAAPDSAALSICLQPCWVVVAH